MTTTDLRDEPAFLFNLLNNGSAWRERVVEEVVFGSAVHARVTSSFQVNLPRALAKPFVDSNTHAVRAYLPLTTRAKENLLNLDLTGPNDTAAHLLPRGFIAEWERLYLMELAADATLHLSTITADLLEAICGFSPSSFRDYFVRTVGRGDYHLGLAHYLNGGLGLTSETKLTVATVAGWCASIRRVQEALVARLGEPASLDSSAEVVLLALPAMVEPPRTPTAIDGLVRAYEKEVLRADDAGATDFLRALAEYGRRFEVIIEAVIPIDERVTLRISEDRPLNLAGRYSRQRFALKEAASGHFEARASDPMVRLGDFRATDPYGHRVGLPIFEAARATDETVSIYSSNEDRPELVDIGVRLRTSEQVWLSTVLMAGVLVAACVAVWVVRSGRDLVASLTVLVVPTTLASAFLLTREQTALAALLQRRARWVLAILIAALWSETLIRLL